MGPAKGEAVNLFFRKFGILGFVWCWAVFAAAQTVEAPKTANDYYQSALQAYLAGDFDQAILLDSKALQVDPRDKKSAALLSLLVSEKDTANRTVIWIGGKPSLVGNEPVNPAPQAPVTVFKEKPSRQTGVDSGKLKELETRIQTVAFLMERDSASQYRELTGAQVQTTRRLDDISLNLKGLGFGMWVSNLLFILALAVSGLALWKSWVNSKMIKKQMRASHTSSHPEEKGKIVKIHRA